MTCSCNEGEESIQDHRQTVNTLREQGRETMENPWKPMVLLMAEILHQLKLVVYPIIYRVGFFTSQVMQNFFHQQWHWDNQSQKICLFESDFQKKQQSSITGVMCPGSWTAHEQTNPEVIIVLPTQTMHYYFRETPPKPPYTSGICIKFDTPQIVPLFFPWNPNPNIPKATSGSKDKETTILEPAAESWGWWWIQRLTSNKTLGI